MNTYYLTTSIPYVNAAPHIGFALELVQADTLARWRRQKGDNVRLQTGTDENSLKNVAAAEAAGVPVADLVAQNAARFHALHAALDIQADDFIRTSCDARHRPAVEAIWNRCLQQGDLYRREYTGFYCNGCEQFYEPEELENGCCPEHQVQVHEVREENWFFCLTRYAEQLEELISSRSLEITPVTRRNEILSFIRSGLADFSVSRSSARAGAWGIPVPGDPEQTIYVWFDALVNYLSALGYPQQGIEFTNYWQEAGAREHLLGKGVTRFHAIYWPAILLSAGLPLPTRIIVHGYVTVEGRKIGKSNGNAVDPLPLINTYGADAIRYYLLRHIRSSEDGDFSVDRLETAYTAELAGGLGNLLNRVLSVGQRTGLNLQPKLDSADKTYAKATETAIDAALASAQFQPALNHLFDLVAYVNRRVTETQPWQAAKRLRAEPENLDLQEEVRDALEPLYGLIAETAG